MEEAAPLLSSAVQLSTPELPLPGSPSKLSPGFSESHPAAICHLLGLSPEILEKNETPSPLQSGSQHGGLVYCPALYFKGNCRWHQPPLATASNQ